MDSVTTLVEHYALSATESSVDLVVFSTKGTDSS